MIAGGGLMVSACGSSALQRMRIPLIAHLAELAGVHYTRCYELRIVT